MSVYYISKCPDYLEHHGIKGQKWGERNYQYKDGSLTPAGRKRYLKGTTLKEKIADTKSKFEAAKKKRAEEREAKLLEKEKKLQEKEEIRARKEENLRMEAELRSEKNLAKFQKKQVKHQKRVDRGKKLLTAALIAGGIIAIKNLSNNNDDEVPSTAKKAAENVAEFVEGEWVGKKDTVKDAWYSVKNVRTYNVDFTDVSDRVTKALSGSTGLIPIKDIM